MTHTSRTDKARFHFFALSFTAVSIAVVSQFVFFSINKTSHKLKDSIELIQTAEQIRWLDEVNTNITRNYVLTGNIKWLEKYPEYYKLITEKISRGIELSRVSNLEQLLQKQKKLDDRLYEMETRAMNLVKAGQKQQALSVMDSDEYRQVKLQYSDTLGAIFADPIYGVDGTLKRIAGIHSSSELIYYITFVVSLVLVVLMFTFGRVLFRLLADITEYQENLSSQNKELTEAVERARQSDQLKSAFISNLSHEIRTPLNGIVGYSELISLEDSKDSIHEYSNSIQRCSQYLIGMISNMLDISRIETGQIDVRPATFSLKELVDDVLIVSYGYDLQNVDVNTDLSHAGPDEVNTDRLLLKQVLVNLVSNALKFTHEGSVSISCRRSGSRLFFEVSDTGIGMTEDELQHIFDRFYKIKPTADQKVLYGGSGLGLAIARSCVELLDGELKVDSQPGEGSVFSFSIPTNSTYIPADS